MLQLLGALNEVGRQRLASLPANLFIKLGKASGVCRCRDVNEQLPERLTIKGVVGKIAILDRRQIDRGLSIAVNFEWNDVFPFVQRPDLLAATDARLERAGTK